MTDNSTDGNNSTSRSNSTTNYNINEVIDNYSSTVILLVFVTFALGALAKTCLRKVPIPYAVVLMVAGLIIGIIFRYVPGMTGQMIYDHITPQYIIGIFLPLLIFEAAFAMEIRLFLKSFFQILILAVPGFLIGAFLVCTFCMYVFKYDWSWYVSMMFGALICTTAPAAVITLLKDAEGSQQFSTVLEGESLINIGVAIIVFNIFKMFTVPGVNIGGLEIFIYLLKVILGGTLFGFVMGKLTTLWLTNIVSDPLTEIGITIGAVYITFNLGESWLELSGVFPAIAMSITVSAARPQFTPEMELFLSRFWQALGFLTNCLIFFLVGVIITENAIYHTRVQDWFVVVALYCLVFLTRGIVLGILSPILVRIGYGLTWRRAAVMAWCALRGPVSLMLALIVLYDTDIDITGTIQSQVYLHGTLLVFLILIVNATSTAFVLKSLGMSEISMPKRFAMASAVRNLRNIVLTLLNSYKTDRFLADADWKIVVTYVEITDPYETTEEEAALDQLTNLSHAAMCPDCETEVAPEPTKKELEEMTTEARLRILKAEKMSYWKQYAEGMLSKDVTRRLVELVEAATNLPDPEEPQINLEDLKKSWKINKSFSFLKEKLARWSYQKPSEEMVVWPKNKIRRLALKICLHSAFDIFLYTVVFLNVVIIIVDLSYTCPAKAYELASDILNYIFTVIYLVEAIIKITAYKVDYFKDKWCLLDFFILVLSIAEILLDFTVLRGNEDATCTGAAVKTYFSPALLKIAKVIRLLRLLRSLRLAKALVPQILGVVDGQVDKKLRFGYEVGVGYVTGEEDVIKNMDIMVANATVAELLTDECEANRKEISRELGELQRGHPGIAVSVKTEQAARRILIKIWENISKLKSEGVLDEIEADKLHHMVDMKLKELFKMPYVIDPPPAEKIISNLKWIADDQELINYIKTRANLVTMQEGEQMDVESDPHGGIYVIISGLIKVDRFVEDFSYRTDSCAKRTGPLYQYSQILNFVTIQPPPSTIERISDYISTGAVLGEISLLTGKPSKAIITCDTSVQMYHIEYETIQAALELFTDAPSLEYRLWKVAAVRIAVPIVKKVDYFKNWEVDRITMHLNECPLVMKNWHLVDVKSSLNPYVFDLGSLTMIDVVLIFGFAQDPETGALYLGPCYIPKTVKTIHLLPCRTEKHVLLVISPDLTLELEGELSEEKGDLMETLRTAIQIAPVPSTLRVQSSSRCLLHSARERKELNAKVSCQKLNADSNKIGIMKKVSGMMVGSSNSGVKKGSPGSASLTRRRTSSTHVLADIPSVSEV